MSESAPNAIDSRDFRRALSQFPTGVSVITTRDEDSRPVGVTASSFSSVSLSPPLILWSIDKNTQSASTFENATYFSANILRGNQIDVSNRFARSGKDKFSDIDFSDGLGGSPLLNDCAARFQCKTWNVYDGGDHLILVGEVIDYDFSDATSSLVFHRGRYATPEPHPSIIESTSQTVEAKGFVGDFLLYMLRQCQSCYREQLYPRLMKTDVNIEEWRLLSLLTGHGPSKLEEISPLVSQPLLTLRETAEWLKEKGYVELSDDDIVSLTITGKDFAEKLLDIARSHEQEVLSVFSEEEAQGFKKDLRKVWYGLLGRG